MFYAVKIGRNPGIYHSWEECEKEVKNFSGTKFKKFNTCDEATQYLQCPIKSKKKSRTKIYSKLKTKSKSKIDSKSLINKTSKKIEKEDNHLYIYTDGGCINNGKKNSKGGYGVYIGGTNLNDVKNISENLKSSTQYPATNIRAELKGLIEGFKLIEKYFYKRTNIVFYTDCEFAIRCCGQMGKQMSLKNWKDNNGKLRKNHDLYKEVFNLSQKYKKIVTIKHIRSHTGKDDIHSIGNENADKLASKGIFKK